MLPAEETDNETSGDAMADLLMRHSSPLERPLSATRGGASPLTERNSNPSPLRLNRPRSNPRNRTPMRYQSPLNADAFRIAEEQDQEVGTNEARRITIRPMAGRAVGTTVATAYTARQSNPPAARSRKQGPSHRKVRRWNNDNFVNLAAEIQSGNGAGRPAAQALLMGQADAARYRSIYDPAEHSSSVMTKFQQDESLRHVRERFYDGEALPTKTAVATPRTRPTAKTPEQMLHQIDARLRRVVVKACENSFPASKVVSQLEDFLTQVYPSEDCSRRRKQDDADDDWEGLLVEPPTVTHRKKDNIYMTRFLFDGDSAEGGFHRLLLHGLCQFHGLKATSSTLSITPSQSNEPVSARLLTASGSVVVGPKVRLVDYIMQRQQD